MDGKVRYKYTSDSSFEFAQTLFDLADLAFEYGSPWNTDQFQRILTQHHVLTIVAYTADKIVGFLCGACTAFEAEIYILATDKGYQKQGIASQLLAYLIDHMSKYQVKDLWLEVRQSNLSAIRFYRKQGFDLIGIRKNYYKNPSEDALILKYENNILSGEEVKDESFSN